MTIDDDAQQLLVSLAQYATGPGDPERGRHALEGEALVDLTKLTPGRLNDAVAILEGLAYAEVRHYMGTHPFDFGEVSLTARGRKAAQTAAAEKRPRGSQPSRPVSDARFSVGAMLGEGTYGEVWRASDIELKRPVAIKFVLAPGDQDALAHARALARVTHPNIVAVYDVTTLTHPKSGAASQAVVMELVDGKPLVELIGPGMSRDDLGRVGVAIIGALESYHSAGLAHLDVHDGNVMVAKDGVKVLDPLYYETCWFSADVDP